MFLAGTAAVPLTGGLRLPFGSRRQTVDGLTDIRDELYARALVLDDTFRQIALVAVDLFAIDGDLAKSAGEQLWETLRILPGSLFVVPTGTMTAPLAATLRGLPPRPGLYAEHVGEQIAAAATYAAKTRRPAAIGWGAEAGARVARVDTDDGAPIGLLFELPALPGGGGQAISADYPGEAVAVIERLSPGSGAVGVLGAAAQASGPETDWEPLGRRVGAAAWAAAGEVETRADVRLAVGTQRVSLPFELGDPHREAARLEQVEEACATATDPIRKRWLEGEVDRARQAFAAAQNAAPLAREVDLIGIGLGDGAFIGCPLLVSEAAAELARERSAYGDFTLIASGVNGVLGVLTTAERRLPELERWYAPLALAGEAAERFAAAVGELTVALVAGEPGAAEL